LAAISRVRTGAASTVPVMVRWRHSPAMPITPRSRMNSPVKSLRNSSRASRSVKPSVSVAARTTTSSDSATAEPVSAKKVRVVRSLSSSARRRALTPRLP